MLDTLVHLGLSKAEARVYLMLLKVGSSPASSLAKRLKIKRATVYSLLSSLQRRRLVSFKQGQGFRRYLPHDPCMFLYDLKQEYSRAKLRIEEAKCLVDRLASLQPLLREEPCLALYEGEEAILELQQGFSQKEDLFLIVSPKRHSEFRAAFPVARLRSFSSENEGFSCLLMQKNQLLIVFDCDSPKAAHIQGLPYAGLLNELLLKAFF